MAKNAKNLGRWLEELDEKRRGVREIAITSIVDTLTAAPSHKLVEEKCVTMYSHCLTRLTAEKKSSKKFSNTEVHQAVRALSLLAINLVEKDQTFEVYEECLVVLSGVLDRFEVYEAEIVIEVLGCLAMLGVFGSRCSMETEKALLVVWKFIMDNDNDNGVGNSKAKLRASVLASAIRAWSFLLTSMCLWRVSYNYCKDSISYLTDLVEREGCYDVADYESVVLAATDALALIFDTDFLTQFLHESKAEKDYSSLEKKVKAKFNKRNSDVLKYLDQKCAKLSHVYQMKTIKTFLGEKGFASHMHTNENLHSLFGSVLGKTKKGEDVHTAERDEVVQKFYQPAGVTGMNNDDLLPHLSEKEKKLQKRMLMSSSSNLNKARTQLLNKQRQLVSHIDAESEIYD